MYSNPAIGRGSNYIVIPSREDEYIIPDAMLTLSIILICITSPFWLVYLLFNPKALAGSFLAD